jgi:hypothetical protein
MEGRLMPTNTYTALATVTLTGSDSSITFSSIPSTYRDLIFVINGTPADTAYPVHALRFNSDSGNNYTYVGMTGNGSSAASGSNSSLSFASLGQAFGIGPGTSSYFSTIAQIMDYSATDKHKTVLVRNNVSGVGVEAQADRWANTAAITSVTLITSGGAGFATGTTINLFGVIA